MSTPEGFEFRPANDNEMAQFDLLTSYVFASPRTDDSPPPLLQPEWTHCAFKDQHMAASSGVWPFVVRVNGKTAPMHGVTGVGTEPAFRRRGLVRQIITDLLHRAKDEGLPGSILLASRGAIYQRFGYGLSSTTTSYDFDPREAVFLEDVPDNGSVHRLHHEEAKATLPSIYKAYARSRNMLTLRAEMVWGRYLDDVSKNTAFCVLHKDENDNPDGYATYKTKWEPGANEQEMVITDLAWTSIEAYRAIWNFLISHDLVGNIKWQQVPEDDPAPGLLREPRCLNRKNWDGIWFRIVDVQQMMTARGYDVDGEVTFTVADDDICPWNNGTYSLRAVNGDAEISQVDDSNPDMICSINDLGCIVSGFSTPGWLAQIDRVKINSPAKTAYINQLFSTVHRPELSFGF